jgi:hypothetical protein
MVKARDNPGINLDLDGGAPGSRNFVPASQVWYFVRQLARNAGPNGCCSRKSTTSPQLSIPGGVFRTLM